MKKLAVKKNAECMACLQCVQACSEAFYKEFHPDYSCIQIVAGKNGGAKPNICIQCGKCMKACEHGAITQNPKTGVYMINKKLCVGCGKCVEACPMLLQPVYLYRFGLAKDLKALNRLNLLDCMECGSCAFTCPGKLPLVEQFRKAKQLLREAKTK